MEVEHEDVLFALALLTLAASTAHAQTDPCAGMRGFDYHHCSTALQDDMMVREGLANLTPRKRRLNRLAGIAVDQFRAGHGRFPNYRDRRWGQSVVEAACAPSAKRASSGSG
jgi:hypothetical protein